MADSNLNALIKFNTSSKLGDLKSNILKTGNGLEAILHSRVAWFVNDSLRQLENHTCRIAFIGQIKAGKSSLINALIQRPGLLPTDINPSTAVVTKLVFAETENAKDSAVFHFFSEHEWDRLVSGSATRNAPAPGPILPSVRDKLNQLQNRALNQHGDGFQKLMGKHHLFSAITPEVLDTYVSANDDDKASKVAFSDITKMAELFMGEEMFSYPSVIIDTPGVNDQFFVRDEITHTNLADTDIYILILNAQQPLSAADISLLRLIRGLQKDKIIAVINRIDMLDDIAEDGKRIEAYVRETLRRECPQATIPVVMASAAWATAALQGKTHEADTPALRQYAAQIGQTQLFSGDGNDKTALLVCSGIPRLLSQISRMMNNTVAEEQLLPCASTLTAIAENTATSARFGLRSLNLGAFSPTELSESEKDFKFKIQGSVNQLQSLITQIEELITNANHNLRTLASSETFKLQRYLDFVLEDFAEKTANELIGLGNVKTFAPAFVKDALRFRSELAENFAKLYTDISKTLLNRQTEIEAELRAVTKQIMPSLDNVIQFGLTIKKIKTPSLMSLAKSSAIETQEFWMESGFAQIADLSERKEELKLLIMSSYLFAVKDLTEAAQAELKIAVELIVNRMRLIAFSTIFPLVTQMERLAAAYRAAGKSKPNEAAPLNFGFLESVQNSLKKDITQYEGLTVTLSDFKKQCFLVAAGS